MVGAEGTVSCLRSVSEEEFDVAESVAAPAAPARRSLVRPLVFTSTITTILALLFGMPWYTVVLAGNRWPAAVTVVGTVVFLGAAVAFPVLMFMGHARRGRDALAV